MSSPSVFGPCFCCFPLASKMQQINNANDQSINLFQHLFQLCVCFISLAYSSQQFSTSNSKTFSQNVARTIDLGRRATFFFEFQYSSASIYNWQPHMLSNNRAISINKIDMLLVELEFRSRRVLFASNSRILRSISYIHSFRSLPRYATSSLLQFSSSQLNTIQHLSLSADNNQLVVHLNLP